MGKNARYVRPWANFPKTVPKYSGLALTSIPTNDVYDLTRFVSIVVQGMLTIASIRAE